jgi:hypothetical protein
VHTVNKMIILTNIILFHPGLTRDETEAKYSLQNKNYILKIRTHKHIKSEKIW